MQNKQKGFSLFFFLFGSAFFGFAAAFFTLAVFPQISDWHRMQDWIPVNATVVSAKLNSSYDDGSTTYSVSAQYSYEYKGIVYQNKRVAISEGSDNIGSYQQDLFRRIERQRIKDRPVRIWIDPNNPKDSIIDRDMRWGFLAFEMVFGGIGGLVIFASIFSKLKPGRGSKASVTKETKVTDNVANGNIPIIRSNALGKFIGAWFFSILWNAIAVPATYFAYQEYLKKDEPLLLLVFLFIAAGVWLLFYSIRSTLEYFRFGRLELVLDPYPGSIGGNIGGTIKLNEEYNPAIKYQLILSCVHIYYTSGGRNNSRTKHEELVWQREGIAQSDPGDSYTGTSSSHSGGTKLEFCFDIPKNLPVSSEGSDYHEWKLELKADLPGIDLEREFTVPVEEGVRSSSSHIQDANTVPDASEQEIPKDFLRIADTLEGIELYYPPLKGGAVHLLKLLMGLAFVGFIALIGFAAASRVEHVSLFIMFFVAIFGLIVALGIGFSLYQLLHTLKVSIGGGRLISVSRILFPIKSREIAVHEIQKIEKSKTLSMGTQGQTPVAYYKIEAIGLGGEKICIARGAKGEQLADAIIDRINGYIK